jgi:hypothetical protein
MCKDSFLDGAAQRGNPEFSLNQWFIDHCPKTDPLWPEGHAASYAAALRALSRSGGLLESPVARDAGRHLQAKIPLRKKPLPR